MSVCSGKCLCGSVEFKAKDPDFHFGACHCSMCTTWGGGPFLAVECNNGLEIKGEEFISTYNSSEWANRAFCKSCGTHLYYHLIPKDMFIVSLGMMRPEASSDVKFDHQIFIDEKPAYYNFADETICKTGAEVFAEAQDSLS